MEITLRQAIMMRINGKDANELYEVIQDSVRSQEQALPGLGVLFEVIWENSQEDTRQQLVSTLKEHVPQ